MTILDLEKARYARRDSREQLQARQRDPAVMRAWRTYVEAGVVALAFPDDDLKGAALEAAWKAYQAALDAPEQAP